jgi:aspartate racemase
LLQLGEEENVLLLVTHAIVSDHWSMGIFYRELSPLYEAFASGNSPSLPEPPIQYAHFARWQRQWFQGPILEEQLTYWKQQLRSIPSVLDLPTDRRHPASQTYTGATQYLLLSSALSESLKALSRQEGATLFMILLAAFQVLLHRYTGQDIIAVGSTSAGRTRVDTEGLIGPFVNTLIMCTDVSGKPTFRELLGRVRKAVSRAHAHQELPFERLIEHLQPKRHLERSPLFQALFQLGSVSQRAVELPGLQAEDFEFDSGIARFDLTLRIIEKAEGLSCAFEYKTDLFDTASITRLKSHFQTLLEGIVADPGQSISTLPLLTERERHQLLVEWNEDQFDDPKDNFLHRRFEAQAERTPEEVALVFEGGSLTYRELNYRANQLANRLQGLGVGPEVLVGICMERSPELVISVLGVLKAGGACMPLDTAYPKERLAFMVEDADIPVLLTQRPVLNKLPKRKSCTIICMSKDSETFAQESVEAPASGITSENLAFVFYTSGSTGRPKAVMWSHGKRDSRERSAQSIYELTNADRHLLKSSIGFTLLVREIFWPLLTGAQLVIARPGGERDFTYLVNLIGEHRITIINLVPSTLRAFLEEQSLETCDSLRHVICLGESLSAELQELFFARLVADLSVFYGATEAPSATFWKCKREDNQRTVGIGRRLANKQIYLLDSHLQPVPIGVAGELYVGGRLARGYLNRPELTAERFIPNPFSNESGARIYNCGDLARYLPDGNLAFIGRMDHQVKVHGRRIELGEIEAVLNRHLVVRESVAVAWEDVPDEKRLVAYVVLKQSRAASGSELRDHLRRKLPEYMVPSVFMFLDALPRTPNGKIDRPALPEPVPARPELGQAFLAPRSPLEDQLAKIWEQLLGLRSIGIRDNFFEIGGHSLLAVRLVAQIQKAFGQKLPLAALFQAPTVEQLACMLRDQRGTASQSSLIALQPVGPKPPFFCVPGDLGNVFTDLGPLARHLPLDQPFYGLQDGIDNPAPIEALAAQYLDEVRSVQPKGPYFLGGVCLGGVVAFEMAQQLRAQGQRVGLLALIEPSSPPAPGLRAYFKFARWVLHLLTRRIGHHWSNFVRLGSAEQQTYARLKLKLFANVWALTRYAPRAYPDRITLFMTEESLARSPRDPRFDWRAFAGGGLDLQVIPGNHDTITGNNDTKIEEAHMQVLADKLRACMGTAESSTETTTSAQ